MQNTEAIRIVEALIDGVDPVTGEVLPEASPYNHPEVIRALARALGAMIRSPHQKRRQQDLPANAGKAWTKEEDQQLIKAFDEGCAVKDIAAKHARTQGSIASRLVRLGKISDRAEVYMRPPLQDSP